MVSGITGALLTAVLSYVVRLKLRAKEELARQQRLANVYFLQLTDLFAMHLVLKDIADKLTEMYGSKDKSVSLTHAAAVFFADQLGKAKPEDLKAAKFLSKPVFEVMVDSLDKVQLSGSQLAELPDQSIYFYNRYMTKAVAFKMTVKVFAQALEEGDHKLLTADVINSGLQSYQEMAEAASLVRAAVQTYGGIPKRRSYAALVRSYKAIKADIHNSLSQGSRLEAARKALKQAVEASPSVPAETTYG